jgi:DNA-binding NtrC family response regulator
MENNKIDSSQKTKNADNDFTDSSTVLKNIKQTPFKITKKEGDIKNNVVADFNKEIHVLYTKQNGDNTSEVYIDEKKFNITKTSVTNLVSLAFEINPDCIVAHFQNGEDCEPYLQKILRLKPLTKLIIITKDPSLYKAVRIIEAGAFDYIISPVDKEELSNIIKRASKQKNLESVCPRKQSKLNSA